MSLLPSSWSRLPTAGDDRPPEVERRRLKILLITLGVAAALLGAAAIWIVPRIGRRLEQRSVRQAREFLQRQDYRRAELMLEQAVQDNPSDFDARRELAKFYQEADSVRALAAWKQLVQDEPANDDNRLGLANAGLQMGSPGVASEALAGVGPAGRDTVEYHRLAAGIALQSGNRRELAAQLGELARLQPGNDRAQFNHAALQLAEGAPAEAEAARAELLALARGDALRIRATLELIRDATRRTGSTVYSDLAERVLPGRPGRPLPLWLDRPRSLFDLVQYMQAQPSPQPEDAALLADWMRREGMAADAVLWLSTLNPSVQSAPQVLAARVSCLVLIPDWRGLEAGLKAGAWGRVADDALALAFAARLQRERLHPDHAAASWDDALEVAGRSPSGLRVLLRLARAFGWREQEESTLRALVKASPRDGSAWQGLAIALASRGATARLYDLYLDWSRSSPADGAVEGVRLWLGVLLGRVQAQDFRSGPPPSPAYAAARALALHNAGSGGLAQAILDGLPASARSDPRVSLVQGLLWAEAGRRAEGERALARVAAGPLLPEERELVASARRLIGAGA